MANIKKHTEKSREVFGEASLGVDFQKLLDEHRFDLGRYHRKVDHDWERLRGIGEQYGEQGLKEIILHLCMDYGLLDSASEFMSDILQAGLGHKVIQGLEVTLVKRDEEEEGERGAIREGLP